MLKRRCFANVPNCFNAVRMRALETLFSKNVSAVPNHFKYCQNVCFRDIIFKKISVVLNRFKYVRMHAFKDFLDFAAFANTKKYILF